MPSDAEKTLKIVSLTREFYKNSDVRLEEIFTNLDMKEVYDKAVSGKGHPCMTIELTEGQVQKLNEEEGVRVQDYYELNINI